MLKTSITRALVGCIAVFCAACSGNVKQEWQTSSTQDGGDARLGRADLAPLRRLTATQYTNTIADLFGAAVIAPPLGVEDLAVNGLVTAGAASVGVPARDAEAFTNAAANIAAQLTVSSNRSSFVCQPSGTDDIDCITQIIDTQGRKIFRRPLSTAQRNSYVALAQTQAQTGGGVWAGVQGALAAMLQSPYFLFRIDTAQAGAAESATWDSYTLASRLSYLIWNTTPDETLLAAAESGALLTSAGLQGQVDRLLSDPRADTGLFEFFQETLQLDSIATAQKDPNVFTDVLRNEMTQQVVLTLTDLLLTTNSDYRTMFTSQQVFVNPDLAARYGYPVPPTNGFVKILYSANDRAGLFGMPGITTMLSPSSRSSPTKRGGYIRTSLLCTAIPSPPASVNTSVTADPTNPRTMRMIMSEHATNPECSGCHSLMDPLGFAIDDFDWLGNYRTQEVGLPLDLTGSIDGYSFVNARTFGAALAASPQLTNCLTQRFLLYATGTQFASQDAIMVQMNQAFASSTYRFKSLVRAYALSAAFRSTSAPS